VIRFRYNRVRWIIAALTLLLIVLGILLRPTGGALILFVLLLLASVGAVFYPPGFYVLLFNGLLLTPVCPECQGQVEWAIEQGSTNPYLEQLVVRCPGCGKTKIEFSFDPT
jgi:endogenous inhibitor of DNA gyrase (YacG/DUF329 family)